MDNKVYALYKFALHGLWDILVLTGDLSWAQWFHANHVEIL